MRKGSKYPTHRQSNIGAEAMVLRRTGTQQMKMPPPEKKVSYMPTQRERAVLQRFFDRGAEAAPRLRVTRSEGVEALTPDHPIDGIGSALLMEAIGTTDQNFLNQFLLQLANVGSEGPKLDEAGINFLLAVVKGIAPRDQIEAMLAAQMGAVHLATMRFARRLATADFLQELDMAERAFNKLTRTFAGQMETLRRYRSDGVNPGAQAIPGDVTQGEAEGAPKKAAGAPALPDRRKDGSDAPVDAGRERVPLAERVRRNGHSSHP
jgi:hypothetical protein